MVLHNIIKYLITVHFCKRRLKAYSKIIVNYDTEVSVDNFLLNLNSDNYLSLNKRILNELKLHINELSGINAFMFDYTNDISEENIKNIVKKYQKKDKLLFVVGTRWLRKYKKRVIDTRYRNIRIIKHDLFFEIIGIRGAILKIFKHIIELNYIFDLNSLREGFIGIKENFQKKYKRGLFVNDDLRKDLIKRGFFF